MKHLLTLCLLLLAIVAAPAQNTNVSLQIEYLPPSPDLGRYVFVYEAGTNYYEIYSGPVVRIHVNNFKGNLWNQYFHMEASDNGGKTWFLIGSALSPKPSGGYYVDYPLLQPSRLFRMCFTSPWRQP